MCGTCNMNASPSLLHNVVQDNKANRVNISKHVAIQFTCLFKNVVLTYFLREHGLWTVKPLQYGLPVHDIIVKRSILRVRKLCVKANGLLLNNIMAKTMPVGART